MKDHAQLIDDLGGGTAVAVAIWGEIGANGKRRETVYKWKQNGIPWRWRPAIEKLARERGLQLPPDFLLPHDDTLPGGHAQQPAA